MEILSINSISKNYGAIRAVNQLSLQVEQGNVYGILGPNGSGKTTTLGIILGVIKANTGNYSWLGKGDDSSIRKNVGSLLETPNFYPYLSGYKNLEIACLQKEVSKSDIPRVLEIVNLTDRQHSKFKTYSLGMKQRLALAATMLGNPDVLVLDEPTNGLDPQGIAEVRKVIIQQAKEGKTIIIASHILDEVERICSHVAVLKQGNLLAAGSISSVLTQDDFFLIAARDMEKLNIVLQKSSFVKEAELINKSYRVVLEAGYTAEQLNKHFFEKGIILTQLQLQKQSLESQFLQLVK